MRIGATEGAEHEQDHYHLQNTGTGPENRDHAAVFGDLSHRLPRPASGPGPAALRRSHARCPIECLRTNPRVCVAIQRRGSGTEHHFWLGRDALYFGIDYLPAPGERLSAVGKTAKRR